MKKTQIKKILSDNILIYAYRKKLWKNGITPKFKLSDEVLEFLEFLESYNHLEDFINLHDKYNEVLDFTEDGIPFYRRSKDPISEYFTDRPKRFYLRGAYNWYKNYKELWENLEELWVKKINR